MASGIVEHVDVRTREELLNDPRLELLEGAMFCFAGGDQTRITSRFGGAALCTRTRELYEKGGTIAGTSSGASVMSEVMMTGGDENTSREEGVSGGAESTAARIGIDEDTAMVMRGHECFDVLGSGAVYIVDGKAVTYSREADDESHLSSVFGICLYVLTEGDTFDLHGRVPNPRKP